MKVNNKSNLLNIFNVSQIPSEIQNSNKSLLIIGSARMGKTSILNEIFKNDINTKFLLNQDKMYFHEFNEIDYKNDIDSFEKACNESSSIYLDDVHPNLKEDLISKYFKLNENNSKSKLIVTIQSLDDFVDASLIGKFDVILFTKNNNSLLKHKELFSDDDFERLSNVKPYQLLNLHYLFFSININKTIKNN